MISPMLFSRPELRDYKSEDLKKEKNFSKTEESGVGTSETARMIRINVWKTRHVFVMEKRL